MGQEDEETAELLATIQKDHVAMKTWYKEQQHKSNSISNLQSKYGPYPDFWRDVIHWKGWKEVRKVYLHHLSAQERSKNSSDTMDDNPIPKKKKRRSRWSSQPPEEVTTASKRKSRWARLSSTPPPTSTHTNINNHTNTNSSLPSIKPTAKTGILGLLPGMPAGMTADQLTQLSQLQSRLKIVNQKLSTLDLDAIRIDNLPRHHPDRSPSPPPIYGTDGKRKNTRAVRWRERYTQERQDCLELIMELNPNLRPPGFIKRKRTNKVYVPVKEHPTYNFIGLIIGPRGKTQKEMESKTGCKIAIRGKGSVKEGARGRRDGKPMEGDDEPLHVVITGDDQASVDKATKMIEDMLVVIDDEKNVHKQQQLRELALLNGTLKEEEFCHICAEKGHRTFECPKRFQLNKPGIQIKCAICGDTSHVTSDCTQKATNLAGAGAGVDDQKQLDSDYQNFMDELDGKKPASTTQCIPVPAAATPIPTPVVAATTTAPGILPPQISSGIPGVTLSAGIVGSTTTTLPPPGYPPTTAAYAAPPPPMSHSGQTLTSSTIPPPMQGVGIPPSTTMPPTTTAYAGYQNYYQSYPQATNPAASYYQQPTPVAGAHPYAMPPPSVPPPNAYPANGHAFAPNGHPNGHANGQYSEETSGWDYRSYYGTADYTGGDGAGAGGFNWWESS